MKPIIYTACPTKWGPSNPYSINSLLWNYWQLGVNGIQILPPTMYDEYPLSEARNVAVEEFLESDATHLFFYDDDHVFPSGTLVRLVKSAEESGQPIVSGWYQARKGTGTIVLFQRLRQGRYCDVDNFSPYRPYKLRELLPLPSVKTNYGRLVKVDGLGMGCCLVHRDVFESTDYPWFLEWSPAFNRDLHHFGEDLWFCDKMAEAGIPLYVNLSCFVGHWAKQGYVVGWQHLQRKALQEGLMKPEELLR